MVPPHYYDISTAKYFSTLSVYYHFTGMDNKTTKFVKHKLNQNCIIFELLYWKAFISTTKQALGNVIITKDTLYNLFCR